MATQLAAAVIAKATNSMATNTLSETSWTQATAAHLWQSRLQAVRFCLLGLIGLLVLRLVHRWTLHPLASIPGPSLARLTRLWAVKNGLSGHGSQKLLQLHQQYGDIIQIGPNEVSLNSIAAYDLLYSQKTKFPKDETWYYGIIEKAVTNVFTITDRQAHVDLAMGHVQRSIESGHAISLYDLATSYTLDTISKISFGDRAGALDRPGLDDSLLRVLGNLFREKLPIWRSHYQSLHRLNTWTNMSVWGDSLGIVSRSVQQAEEESSDNSLVKDAIRRAKEINYELPVGIRATLMSQIVTAGYGTTAISICGTLQYMLRNPKVYKRAQEELKSAWPKIEEPLGVLELERLSFFDACIKEGLRMSCPAPLRMPRVVGTEGFSYGKHFLPPGTLVSSSNYFFCFDEKMFPNAHSYDPARWFAEDLKDYNLYWMIFSKGNRSCIGIHMALAEIRIFVSNFVRRFEIGSFVDDFRLRECMVVESDTPMRMYLRNIS